MTQRSRKKAMPRQKALAAMSRKQALGILHHLYEKYIEVVPIEQFRQEEAWRKQVLEAFCTLALSIHGKPDPGQCSTLCEECHEAYYSFWTEIKGKYGYNRSHLCCTACKDRLLAAGKLLTIEGKPVVPHKGEEMRNDTAPA